MFSALKKNLGFAGLVFLFLFSAPGVFAAELDVKSYAWQDKLWRGFVNVLSSPVEIAREIHVVTNRKNLALGWSVGLAQGLGEAVVRLGAGVVDMVTCPFNFPEKNKAPLIDPEFVWQKPGVHYT